MPAISDACSNERLVDFGISNVGKRLGVIWIIEAADNGLL
jgi:hypothetical protein